MQFYIKRKYKPGERQCLSSLVKGIGNFFDEMPWHKLKGLFEGSLDTNKSTEFFSEGEKVSSWHAGNTG